MLTSNPLPELISGANCVSRGGRHPRAGRGGAQAAVYARARARRRASRRPVVSAPLLIQKAVAAPQRYTPDDAFCIAYSTAQWTVGVRVLKYEYEYGRRGCTPRRIAPVADEGRRTRSREHGDRCPPVSHVFRDAARFSRGPSSLSPSDETGFPD